MLIIPARIHCRPRDPSQRLRDPAVSRHTHRSFFARSPLFTVRCAALPHPPARFHHQTNKGDGECNTYLQNQPSSDQASSAQTHRLRGRLHHGLETQTARGTLVARELDRGVGGADAVVVVVGVAIVGATSELGDARDGGLDPGEWDEPFDAGFVAHGDGGWVVVGGRGRGGRVAIVADTGFDLDVGVGVSAIWRPLWPLKSSERLRWRFTYIPLPVNDAL